MKIYILSSFRYKMSFSKDFTTSFVKGLGKTIGVVTIFSTIGVLYNFYLFFNQKQPIKKIQTEHVENLNVETEHVETEHVENNNFDDKRRVVFTESEYENETDLYYGEQNENVSFKMLFDRIK